jgi:hypothetical protein
MNVSTDCGDEYAAGAGEKEGGTWPRLTDLRTECLWSQIATSNKRRGGRCYPPLAFTEHGAILAMSWKRNTRTPMAPKGVDHVEHKPLALKNAPMEYAPANELGVVFLFAHVARRLQFRIQEIRPQFPDCIAYRRIGDVEKRMRIEFEFKSSCFKAHRHDKRKCDIIVCWHHNWPDSPNSIEVIELKRYFGAARKVWILQALKSQFEDLDKHNAMNWGMSKRSTPGDLLLMYRCHPVCAITDIFVLSDVKMKRGNAVWRNGEAYFGAISKACRLESPIFLDDLRKHRILRSASFMRRNMQGVGLLATEYWPYLHDMILARNPAITRSLARFRPDRL